MVGREWLCGNAYIVGLYAFPYFQESCRYLDGEQPIPRVVELACYALSELPEKRE